jgi:tetratricopeptide (TPR) repeat protein
LPVSVVPKLPVSDDGVGALRVLDTQIERAATRPHVLIPLLLERATVRGHVEDYQRAVAESEVAVKVAPRDDAAWKLRISALGAVHRFTEARAALAILGTLTDASFLVEPQATIDDATGDYERALAARAEMMKQAPNPETITLYAAALAEGGRYDEALALLPTATTAVRWNTPFFIHWLLFQWGRIYEQKGEMAAARDFYLEAQSRLPGSVETVDHLARALVATGDRQRAKALVEAAVADNPHPGLRALAIELGGTGDVAAVAAEWERYVAALPEAFADHAARFYLGVGKNPTRALELARLNVANRPTLQARALVVEAALAAGAPPAACAVVDPLVAAPVRADRFTAWKALSACGRTADAERLGHELGI